MKYDKFQYLYPPRPEYKTPAKDLKKYDTGEYIAQPKYNGSACMIFTNGIDLHIYNRHKQLLSKPSPEIEFKKLAKTKKWCVFAGEYLNKGKLGETGVKEKDKFILWDVLVWNGWYLVGETLTERLDILEHNYPCKKSKVGPDGQLELYDHLCCTKYKGIYRAPTYKGNFTQLYKDVIKTDLYEGILLKKKDSKLSFGYQSLNNFDWQIKCRKETKLYDF